MKKCLLLIWILASALNSIAQSDSTSNNEKTVTLTVVGQGKTIDEARTSALRSAIEQAFGAFISTKTEILNDSLFSDEVVSVSNGNIKKFEIIDERKINEQSYTLLIKIVVSISKLSKFVSNKGYESDFDGQNFGINFKMQKLNEEAEAKAVLNSCFIIKNILKKSIDFTIENSEPKLVAGKKDEFDVTFNVSWVANGNFNSFITFTNDVLSKISMSENEVISYKNLNKDIYYISLFGKQYIFRNVLSIIQLKNLFIQTNQYLHNFKIVYETGEIIPYIKNIFNMWPYQWSYNGLSFPNVNFSSQYNIRDGYSSWSVYEELMKSLNEKGQFLFSNNVNFTNIWWEKAMRGEKERFYDDILFLDRSKSPVPESILSLHTYKPDKYKFHNSGALEIKYYNFDNNSGKWILTKPFLLSDLEKIRKFKVINLN